MGITTKASLLNPQKVDFPYIDSVIANADRQRAHPLVIAWRHAWHSISVRRKAEIHYISDYGGYDDSASGEIITRLADAKNFLQEISGRPLPDAKYHDIPAQDTFAAAFDLGQLARGSLRGFGNIFFVNCAPRKKQRGNKENNGGETIYVGILPNGTIIGGTGEDVFTHFKDLVEAGQLNIYRANVATNATQFRSRDYFPWLSTIVAAHINQPSVNRQWRNGLSIEKRDEILFGLNLVDQTTKLSAADIPELPNGGAVVTRADTHGNLKLGVRHDEVQACTRR